MGDDEGDEAGSGTPGGRDGWPGGIGEGMAQWFEEAQAWSVACDPLILDLDGDGLETVSPQAGVLFDHDGDGVLEATGWAAPDDALLARDLDGDGRITSGAELFGDWTRKEDGSLARGGFDALADLDANGDGVVDGADPAFAELRLWRDLDGDGITDAGELSTLEEAGISGLDVAGHYESMHALPEGNRVLREGWFYRADGSVGGVGQFDLGVDTFRSRFADAVAVPGEIRLLPGMNGSGLVRSLHEAAALSPALAGLLSQYAAATTRDQQLGLLDDLLAAWAATSPLPTYEEVVQEKGYRVGYGSLSGDASLLEGWQQPLRVLEAFVGRHFFSLPDENGQGAVSGMWVDEYPGDGGPPVINLDLSGTQHQLLQQAYQALREDVHGALVLQTRLKPALEQVGLILGPGGFRLDASGLDAFLRQSMGDDPVEGLAQVLELQRYAGHWLEGSGWLGEAPLDELLEGVPDTPELQALLEGFGVRRGGAEAEWLYADDAPFSSWILAGGGDDHVQGGDASEHLLGQAGDDSLSGNGGADRLHGGEGNDLLLGGAGGDLLDGGAGNDLLYGDLTDFGGYIDVDWSGEAGGDRYRFGRGDGQDTLIEGRGNPGVDRIVLDAGITPGSVRLERVASQENPGDQDLLLTLDDGSSLRVKGQFGMQDEGTVVEEIRFGDGTVWNVEAIRDRLLTGGEESEILRGFYGRDDHLVGGGGDDLLLGGVGDDLLEGGAGDDELWGDGFDDWGYLYHVCEGHGGDRYLIGRGEGHDVIHEYRWGGGTDQLIFGDGILPESVNVAVEPSQGSTGTWDLVLTLADGGSVRLVEQFDDGELLPAVEEVLFADGTLWDADRMAELAGYQRMEAYWLDPYAPA